MLIKDTLTLGAELSIASDELLLLFETSKLHLEDIGVVLDLELFSALVSLKLWSAASLSFFDLGSAEGARLFITEVEVAIEVVRVHLVGGVVLVDGSSGPFLRLRLIINVIKLLLGHALSGVVCKHS